jgi:hypothetical protein
MDDDLQYLVHFFHDSRYLFRTITMAETAQQDEICDAISSCKAWFWVRFSPGEREGYLERRRFVERSMYDDYTRAWGSLKERVPVYFYLIPGITERQAVALARQRTLHDEAEPGVLMARLDEIEDTADVTFTLDDSHTSYGRRIQEAGLDFGGAMWVPAESRSPTAGPRARASGRGSGSRRAERTQGCAGRGRSGAGRAAPQARAPTAPSAQRTSAPLRTSSRTRSRPGRR